MFLHEVGLRLIEFRKRSSHRRKMKWTIGHGKSYPLGATINPRGVNFSVYSKKAEWVELLFYAQADDEVPQAVFRLDSNQHRSAHYWHAFIEGVEAGQLYAFRVHGPFSPSEGHRFDGEKILLDPYGRSVMFPKQYERKRGGQEGANGAFAAKSVVVEVDDYDWEGDECLERDFSETIIYEMHVRGFTANPNSEVSPERRGTYLGLIDKIPYLKKLGITAVELLPVFQFDEYDAPDGKKNYWGYAPMSFFAVHRGYATRPEDPMSPLNEFRDMVKALHRAGIEVILDVVYNHTAEGDHRGPTFCYKGFENRTYYMLESDQSYYSNYSGTGNTVDASHTVVLRMILESLRFWVEHMHVDGFRFDLASILARDSRGRPLENPPALWGIESDPFLATTKLIAEPWDAGGLYQVGHFVGDRWKEWNGRFRDDVRAFVKGDRNTAASLPSRLLASADLFEHSKREAEQSINFVSCHDGFTLNDLVSYNEKHNQANGEENRDGDNHNLSWNCGIEGPTEDARIEALRERQVKNLLTLTLTALGVPMILMGDEVRRTQQGNNNAYAQNSELSWFDWSLVEKNAKLLRFVQNLIQWRRDGPRLPDRDRMSLSDLFSHGRVDWHGVHLHEPDFGPDSHLVCATIYGRLRTLHLMISSYWELLQVAVPEPPNGGTWKLVVDTGKDPPLDAHGSSNSPIVQGGDYELRDRSIVVLETQAEKRRTPHAS